MKFTSRIERLLPILSVGLFSAVTILQSLAFLLCYEAPESNYFAIGSPFPILACVLSILGAVCGIASIFLIPKDRLSEGTLPCPIASLPNAFGFLAGAVVLLLSEQTDLSKIAILLLFLAAIYSALIAFAKTVAPARKALIGFSAVLSCIMLNAIYYFDVTLEMNAPIKVTLLVGLLASMLYFTAELRYLLEKPAARLHSVISIILLSLGALTALPIPIAFAAGLLNRSTTPANAPLFSAHFEHPTYLAGALVVLGVTIGAAIRLWSQFRSTTVSKEALPSCKTESTETTNEQQEEA